MCIPSGIKNAWFLDVEVLQNTIQCNKTTKTMPNLPKAVSCHLKKNKLCLEHEMREANNPNVFSKNYSVQTKVFIDLK